MKASGVGELIDNATPHDGPDIWKQSKNDLLYFGATGYSIHRDLIEFIEKDKNTSRNYRFLLIDPQSVAFKHAVAYERYGDIYALDRQDSERDPEMKSRKNELYASINRLYNLVTDQQRKPTVEIRFYEQFHPYWLYKIDTTHCYLGALKRGERNEDSQLVILQNPGDAAPANLFTVFDEITDNIWDEATRFDNWSGKSEIVKETPS